MDETGRGRYLGTDEALDWESAECDVCGLPDIHQGAGDGIGSCDCPRCDGGEAAANSALCICPPDEVWAFDG